MEPSILTPVLILVTWSMLVWLYMYARRIPAMQKAGIKPQQAQDPGSLSTLPPGARFAADNYNHLMEQPTIFYALAFYIHLSGGTDSFAVMMAWAYVAIRILHTLVQVSVNIVMVRFSLFMLSSLALLVLAVRSLAAL